MLKDFADLPVELKNESVLHYYNMLKKKRVSLVVKRIFDFAVSLIMLAVISPVLIVIAGVICADSKGSPVFKQERVTKYGKRFYIYKFRTMCVGSESGTQVTLKDDLRITDVGHFLRKYRLDELLQLINILKGDMSFVGTRPEVERYVKCYTDEMYATLLLPAGVTSLASIKYKDEEKLLESAENADETYVNEILPEKMKYNLEYLERFSFLSDIRLMFGTVVSVVKKEEESVDKREDKLSV